MSGWMAQSWNYIGINDLKTQKPQRKTPSVVRFLVYRLNEFPKICFKVLPFKRIQSFWKMWGHKAAVYVTLGALAVWWMYTQLQLSCLLCLPPGKRWRRIVQQELWREVARNFRRERHAKVKIICRSLQNLPLHPATILNLTGCA